MVDFGVVTVTGGTLSALPGSHLRVSRSLRLKNVTTRGELRVMSSDSGLYVDAGPLENAGVITINHNGGPRAALVFDGVCTLNGIGSVVLNDGTVTAAKVTMDSRHQMRGWGHLSGTYVIAGLLAADVPDRTLTLGGADGRLCSVECGGWLRATNGGILQFANAQVDLANGELVADGGIVEIAGGSVSSGRITATNGGHIRVTGGCNLTQVTNHAPVRLMGGMGQATVGGGSLVNHGLITVNYNSGTSCTLNFSPAATLSGTGRLLLNNGRLAGSTLTVGSAQSVGGTGTIAAPYVNAGMLFVGNGIGRLDFEAPLVLQPTSRLQFDLGGSVQGVTHDFLASTHSIELNGVLEVTVHAGLQAALKPADTFRILQSGGVTGTFTNLLPGGRVQTNFGTCLVLIDSTGVSLTDFRGGISWAERHFAPAEQADPAVAGDTADPNSNGLPNLAEYAMGLDPKSRDRGRLPAVAAADGHVAITYQRSRAATDVVITVQESMDLLQWAEATVFETILASDEATETVTARVAVGAGARKFLRLSVKRP